MSGSPSDGVDDSSDISSVTRLSSTLPPISLSSGVQRRAAAVGSVTIQLGGLGKGLFKYTPPRLRGAGCLRHLMDI